MYNYYCNCATFVLGFTNELYRLRLNFSVMMILLFFTMMSFDSALPTIHQYVTNPASQAGEEVTNRTRSVSLKNYEVSAA